MSRTEANVSGDGAVTVSKEGGKSFRNNVGGAWTGKKVKEYTKNGKRYAVIENPRWITFGLFKGSGDRIGWKSITVTADMVGKKFAQFLSLEFKDEKGRARKDQITWHENVWRDGGLTGFCRNDDDVRRVLSGEKVDP